MKLHSKFFSYSFEFLIQKYLYNSAVLGSGKRFAYHAIGLGLYVCSFFLIENTRAIQVSLHMTGVSLIM